MLNALFSSMRPSNKSTTLPNDVSRRLHPDRQRPVPRRNDNSVPALVLAFAGIVRYIYEHVGVQDRARSAVSSGGGRGAASVKKLPGTHR